MNNNSSTPQQTPLNTYVGARYVPVYEGTYDPTRGYEPLSIVTVIMADATIENSYMSVQMVPPNSTDPWEDTNHVYWIHLYASHTEEPTPSFADNVIHTPESLGMVKNAQGYYDLGNAENTAILGNLTTGILFLYDWIYLNSKQQCEINVPVFMVKGPNSFSSENVPTIKFLDSVYASENSVPIKFIQNMPYKNKWLASEIFAFNINDIKHLPPNTELYIDIDNPNQTTITNNITLKNEIKLHGKMQTITINGSYTIENATFVENLIFNKTNNTTGVGVFYYGTNSGSPNPKIIEFNRVTIINAPLMTIESLIVDTVKIKDCVINGTTSNNAPGYIQLVDSGARIENLNIFNVNARFFTICGTAQLNKIKNVLANKMVEHATTTNFMHNLPKGTYLNVHINNGDITVGQYGCTFINCELRSTNLNFNAITVPETTVTLINCITANYIFPDWVTVITPNSKLQLGFIAGQNKPTQHISNMMFYGTLNNSVPFSLFIYLYDPSTKEIKKFLGQIANTTPYIKTIKLFWVINNSSKAEITFSSTYDSSLNGFIVTASNINRPNDARFIELQMTLGDFYTNEEISILRQLP